MASSVSMMASIISGATITQQSLKARRTLLITKATADKPETASFTANKESLKADGRRAAMFAVAATAASVLAGSAFAEEDAPKRGTPEARKKYAPICVTMPTARVCNKVA